MGLIALLVVGLLHLGLGAAEVSVQQGELAEVNSSRAILSMSGDTSQKAIWWQFLPHLKSHPESFLRYLVSIPVPEEELGNIEQVCDKDYLKEIRERGGLLATRDASIAEYQSSEHIKALGTMKVTMWLLAFVCLNKETSSADNCQAIAPVVLRVTPQDFDRETRSWTRYSPAYFSLWEIVSDNIRQEVSNSVPSRILELPTNYYTNTNSSSSVQEFHVRSLAALESYKDLPNCGNLGNDIFADRGTVALLDKGALLPSPHVREAPKAGFYYYDGTSKCYEMDEEFKNATGSELLTVLGPTFLPRKIVGGCQSESPFLFSNQSGYYACFSEQLNATATTLFSSWQFYCVQFDCDEKEVKASLEPYFKAVYKAPRNTKNTLVPLERQSCSGEASVWVRTTNSRSSNFPDYEKPVCENRRAAKPEMCLWGIDPPQNLLQTSSDVDILSSLLSQVKASYVAGHNSLLNLEQGSPTDFWVVAITLPSAFIAVVAGVVPLTDAQLKLVRGLRIRSHLKTGFLCCCNLVLAIVSYSAVVALTPTELQREKSFRTWALHADQVQVTSHGLRVLVVVQGESTYKSDSLILAWVSTAVLMPVVLLITFFRCRQEFRVQKRSVNSFNGMKDTSQAPKSFPRSYSSLT